MTDQAALTDAQGGSRYEQNAVTLAPRTFKSNERMPVKFECPRGKGRSTEKTIVSQRKVHKVRHSGNIYVDSDDVSEEFANKIKGHAICVTVVCHNCVQMKPLNYKGQASIITLPSEVDEKKLFATAKHNFESRMNEKDEFETCTLAILHLPSGPEIYVKNEFGFSDIGWEAKEDCKPPELRNGVTWRTGFDVSTGPRCDPRSLVHLPSLADFVNQGTAFEAIPNGFVLTEETPVAMVVFTRGVVKGDENSDTAERSEQRNSIEDTEKLVPGYLGNGDDILILTGTITYVGKHHVEYNINTFSGCSGAAVFICKEGHDHNMKAIAIHAGYKEELGMNVGCRINEEMLTNIYEGHEHI